MTSVKELPQFVRDILAAPPRVGEGVNPYLRRLARVLHPYRSDGEILDTLRAATLGCGRVAPRAYRAKIDAVSLEILSLPAIQKWRLEYVKRAKNPAGERSRMTSWDRPSGHSGIGFTHHPCLHAYLASGRRKRNGRRLRVAAREVKP